MPATKRAAIDPEIDSHSDAYSAKRAKFRNEKVNHASNNSDSSDESHASTSEASSVEPDAPTSILKKRHSPYSAAFFLPPKPVLSLSELELQVYDLLRRGSENYVKLYDRQKAKRKQYYFELGVFNLIKLKTRNGTALQSDAEKTQFKALHAKVTSLSYLNAYPNADVFQIVNPNLYFISDVIEAMTNAHYYYLHAGKTLDINEKEYIAKWAFIFNAINFSIMPNDRVIFRGMELEQEHRTTIQHYLSDQPVKLSERVKIQKEKIHEKSLMVYLLEQIKLYFDEMKKHCPRHFHELLAEVVHDIQLYALFEPTPDILPTPSW